MEDKITVRLVQSASSRRLTPYWCTECRQLVTMISEEEAVALFATNLELLTFANHEPAIHTMKSSAAIRFICFPSLLRRYRTRKTEIKLLKTKSQGQ